MIERRPVAVITGASSGIGRVAAKQLAAQGWRIIGQGRDPERCRAALADIEESADVGVEMLQADLSSLSETARLADAVKNITPYIDVLLNNAGGVRRTMLITSEGNEATFAGNHLGHFLLTKRLMPVLDRTARTSAPGSVRIIATSSSGHMNCPDIDWSDLQGLRNWASGRNYCLAKLCNLLFTQELSKRTASTGIIAHAMHPGIVDSNFSAHAPVEMQGHMRERHGDTPDKSAATLVWLATDAVVGTMTNQYFHDKALATPSAAARDAQAATRLWKESELLLARSGF